MPITSFTIGGAEVYPLLEGFEIRETEGGVSTLICDVESIGSPVLRFSVRQEVIVKEDDVRIFAGAISQARERGFGGPNIYDDVSGAPQIVTSITAEDYTRLADRAFVTETVAAGTTLKAFLTTLVADYLDDFGVTLHASQVDGPALPALDYLRERLTSVLQKLSDGTGFLWRIDYDKQLRMWAPGDLAAPFDIDETDAPARWTGDVEVETILGDEFANRVTVIVGPLSEDNRVETFIGDGVTDTFDLTYTLTSFPYGLIHRFESDGVTPDGGETFGLPGDGAQWEYDASTNTITRTIGATPADKVYKLTFNGVLYLEAVAEDAASIAADGVYPHIEQRDDALTQAAADALAASILAEKLASGDQNVIYDTRFPAPTLRAGQQQTLTAPARGVSSGPFLLAEMSVRAETPANAEFAADGLGLIRRVTSKKNKAGKWQHTYRDWLGGGNRAAVVASTGTGTPVASGPAPPFTSVQFNRSGVFGGDGSFTFLEAEHSIICGDLCTITAAAHESCQAFGHNSHIADP